MDDAKRRQEVELFFDVYVQWMRADILREIEWAKPERSRVGRLFRRLLRRQRGAGNLLCALGLLVYTEALGRVWRWNFEHDDFYTLEGNERPRKNFEAGFNRLDDGSYGLWREAWEADHPPLYHVLRSGMVHEYRPKIGADMHLGYEQERGVEWSDQRLQFYVVPYHRHFGALADAMRVEILGQPTPSLPDPYYKPGTVRINVSHSVSSTSGSSAR